jgi:trans-2,3-dihydro-3-hydroxyanthranilate isomerase
MPPSGGGLKNPITLVDNRISGGRKNVNRRRSNFATDFATEVVVSHPKTIADAVVDVLRRNSLKVKPNMSSAERKLPMVQVDVFTDRAMTGNSLAVFPDGRGLSMEQMQAIAREMNLSETTFILPADAAEEKARGVRVRIFTVQEELPFAGHPTLGTAFVLRSQGAYKGAPEIRLDLNAGMIPVSFTEEAPRPAFGEMTQKNPEFGEVHDIAEVARVTGLDRADFDESAPVQTVSTGVPFTIVALRSLKALQNLRLDFKRAAEYLERSGGKFFYFVCRETVDPQARLHARMIFYGGDDPATGSAAGCCAGWMVAHGVAASDEQVLIEQGLEVHRPSNIFVRARKQGNQVVNVRVGGNCVEVLRGELTLAA